MRNLLLRLRNEPSVLIKNASWLLSVEGIAKVSRIVTILCMTAFLSPAEYGIAILAVAFHDLFRLLMRSGTGNQVIQCEEHNLRSYAQNAASLQWAFCLGIACLQFFSGTLLADIYDKPELEPLLQIMSISYLLYPWVSIRVYLLHRANKMRYFSLSNGVCIIAENLSIALLLWADFGITAVAISKLVFSSLWLILFFRVPDGGFGMRWQPKVIRQLFSNSANILGGELAKAGRHHADTFIAGRLLSPDMFGLYAFAKNAGVGLSQSLINAYNGALFPYLSELNRNPQDTSSKRTVWMLALGLSAIFILQSVMVPVYVPLLFNEVWHSAVVIVSILCLTAIPNLYLDTLCCYMRAGGLFLKEFVIRLVNLVAFIVLLLIVPTDSPMDFAIAVCIASCIWLVPMAFIFMSTKYFKSNSGTTPDRSKL